MYSREDSILHLLDISALNVTNYTTSPTTYPTKDLNSLYTIVACGAIYRNDDKNKILLR